mmetsp:Transcript_48917/g.116269  ORF Transcript_48917/g.116269 Transcript_48917/m.116269 type:complete len:220 (+) Transcript_48917:206-865(+)
MCTRDPSSRRCSTRGRRSRKICTTTVPSSATSSSAARRSSSSSAASKTRTIPAAFPSSFLTTRPRRFSGNQKRWTQTLPTARSPRTPGSSDTTSLVSGSSTSSRGRCWKLSHRSTAPPLRSCLSKALAWCTGSRRRLRRRASSRRSSAPPRLSGGMRFRSSSRRRRNPMRSTPLSICSTGRSRGRRSCSWFSRLWGMEPTPCSGRSSRQLSANSLCRTR